MAFFCVFRNISPIFVSIQEISNKMEGITMKYRAVCPNCNHHFSRIYFFRIFPEVKHRCPACDARIKLNSLSYWGFCLWFGIPLCVLVFMAIFEIIPPFAGFLIAGLCYTFGIWIFPYVYKFDLVDTASKDHKQTVLKNNL